MADEKRQLLKPKSFSNFGFILFFFKLNYNSREG